jgi:hypothetical protein
MRLIIRFVFFTAPSISIDDLICEVVVVGASGTENGEKTFFCPAKNHAESLRIARSVDGRRADDGEFDALVLELVEHQLAFVLRLLVVVGRRNRRTFVARRRVDVSVHTLRAAIHQLAGAGLDRFLDDDAGAVDVDRFVQRLRRAGLSECGRQVHHDLGALAGLRDGVAVRNAAVSDIGARLRQTISRESRLVVQHADGMPVLQ